MMRVTRGSYEATRAALEVTRAERRAVAEPA
jgi:hypothetical protein